MIDACPYQLCAISGHVQHGTSCGVVQCLQDEPCHDTSSLPAGVQLVAPLCWGCCTHAVSANWWHNVTAVVLLLPPLLLLLAGPMDIFWQDPAEQGIQWSSEAANICLLLFSAQCCCCWLCCCLQDQWTSSGRTPQSRASSGPVNRQNVSAVVVSTVLLPVLLLAGPMDIFWQDPEEQGIQWSSEEAKAAAEQQPWQPTDGMRIDVAQLPKGVEVRQLQQ
jgi:hypothetical protein